jgi:hydrogenase expression/formation protein HypD
MGANEWAFVSRQHHIPTAVAGFTAESLLAAFYSVLRQRLEQRPFLDNCYAGVVTAEGNAAAQRILRQVTTVTDANWRGIGMLPASGFALNNDYQKHDTRVRFALDKADSARAQRRRAGAMPAGCDCARVVLGKKYPNECRLYGLACTPRNPIGPCMVSDEGACRIWWSGGIRAPATPVQA